MVYIDFSQVQMCWYQQIGWFRL